MQESTATSPESEPSAFLRALVEASLPVDELILSESDERTSLEQTTAFVATQLDALPRRLSLLFALGTTAFRFYVVLTRMNHFRALKPADRRRVFESWAYGPVPLFRALFRVIRSTSLLYFFELSAVRQALDAGAKAEGGGA